MRAPRAERAAPEVEVLRLGHRPGRDPRLTTHLALTARAFGVRTLYLNPPDPGLADRLAQVRRRWGGDFTIEPAADWHRLVREWKGSVVHLTMYGLPLESVLSHLRKRRRILVAVGGAKVPSNLYQSATWNVAVGGQPHSEVAALAVLLDRLRGIPRPERFEGAEQRIVPSARHKHVISARGKRA
jgi:tRNA (cytidine56-2'-O)-methyltransferase